MYTTKGRGEGVEVAAKALLNTERELAMSSRAPSVSSDANKLTPSVLGRGPSQCCRLRYSARVSLLGRGGRLGGVYKPGGGERALTVSIPSPLLARRLAAAGGVMLLLVMLSLRWGSCCAHARRRGEVCWRGKSC